MDVKKVSIIMGVYNCSKTIKPAIESILNQSYEHWEFVICDDCSTDDTYEILLSYERKYPNKFIVIRNKENKKLAYSLNHCLKYATGTYIARMDGDDISHPSRLEKQMRFLLNHPDIHLVGTSMQRFNDRGVHDILYSIKNPDKYTLRKYIPFNHATILTYKTVYDHLNGYTVSERTSRSQDYDLWFRFFKEEFTGRNIEEALYFVREDLAAVRRRTFKVRYNAYKTTILGYKLLNYPFYWYFPATLKFMLKSITPYFLICYYRNFQMNK